MIVKLILKVLFMLSLVLICYGCSALLADYSYYPSKNFMKDGNSREIVEKDASKLMSSSSYFDDMLKETITVDRYKVWYRHQRGDLASIWFFLDIMTLGLFELITFPYELAGLYFFRDSYEQDIFYINDRVANRYLGYAFLTRKLLYDTRVYEKNIQVIVVPFTGKADKNKLEFYRNELINTVVSFHNVKVLSRVQLNAILKEQQFNTTIADIDYNIRLGKLAGANYLIAVYCGGSDECDAQAQLISVETGEIIATTTQVIW